MLTSTPHNPTNNIFTSGEWTISWNRKDEKWRGFVVERKFMFRNEWTYDRFRIGNFRDDECMMTIALIDADGTVKPSFHYDYDGVGYLKIPPEMTDSMMEAIKRLAKEHKQDLSA